jgi:hypothetical protein
MVDYNKDNAKIAEIVSEDQGSPTVKFPFFTAIPSAVLNEK